jgi:uncharacterized membrane protein YphA (DoxX/SURF4 family)
VIASDGTISVGSLLALSGLALIAWGITGNDVTFRDLGLKRPLSTAESGGITRKLRMVLALSFGIVLVLGGVALVIFPN